MLAGVLQSSPSLTWSGCVGLVLLCIQSKMSLGACFLLCLVNSQVTLPRQTWPCRTGSVSRDQESLVSRCF